MLKDCWLVTKPGIVAGNLAALTGGFLLAAGGAVDIPELLGTIAGMALVMGGACVLNNCADRRSDRCMGRTCGRALAQGRMSPGTAVAYAAGLGLAGMATLVSVTNGLTVMIVAAGLVVYAGLYSLWLKPVSAHAPLVGGLAGAVPPLAGYCAVTGRFDTEAAVLLCTFYLWQMPHFYAIAVYRKDEYAAAAIPVLPVTRGVAATKRHIVAYIPVFTAAALALGALGYAGPGYVVVTSAAGLLWLAFAVAGYRTTNHRRWARRLFICSLVVICALDLMMSADCAAPGAPHQLSTDSRPSQMP